MYNTRTYTNMNMYANIPHTPILNAPLYLHTHIMIYIYLPTKLNNKILIKN